MKNKPRILVIDDEKVIRNLLRNFLSNKGYPVTVVSNRKAAFGELKKNLFDVVLLDVRLPGVDGVKLLKDIKRRDPYIEVIVITGYTTLGAVVETLRSGAYDYMLKPFSLDELKIVIDRCFEKQRLAGENVELKEIVALFEVSRLITSKIDLDKLLNQVLISALQITRAKRGSILILDETKKQLKIKAAKGLSQSVIARTRIKLGEGISGMVAKEGEPLLVTDIDKDKRFKRRKRAKYETNSFISVPMISLPLKVRERVMGVINLSDKINGDPFTERDLHVVSVLAGQAAVATENAQLFELLRGSYMGTVRALVNALEEKDKVSPDHSGRVARFAVAIAEEIRLPADEIEGLRMAAFLHDVGKLGIDISFLAKTGKLTKAEWEVVRKHPLISAKIINGVTLMWDIIPLVRHHHERIDGRGFPGGLKGEAIPLGARILAVADAFEAMTSDRPYRKAYSRNKALAELKRLRGVRYDRRAVNAIEKVLRKKKI